jgi:hypothetical protein
LRLAALRLREGDPGGAIAALVASSGNDLPDDTVQRRKLLLATATARRGDFAAAVKLIADLDSAEADGLRADIMEQAQDWWGADRALAALVARTIPSEGPLDETQQRVLLRLATAAARAGDDPTLAGLKARESVRMGSGPLADMFRLLTADPVRGTADLQRSRQEAGLARSVPAGLKALQADPRSP